MAIPSRRWLHAWVQIHEPCLYSMHGECGACPRGSSPTGMRSQRRAMRRPAVSVLPGGGSGFDRDSTRTHHFANCVRAHIPLRRILSVSFRSASSNGTSGAARSPGTPCRCRQWRRPRGRSGLSIRHNDAGACLNTTIPADMGSSTLTYGLSGRCRRCPRGQQASPTVMVTPPLFYQISHSG